MNKWRIARIILIIVGIVCMALGISSFVMFSDYPYIAFEQFLVNFGWGSGFLVLGLWIKNKKERK